MHKAPIDVVLFDLGGVLVELSGVVTMRELARLDDDDELWRRWLSCAWVSRFERGQCSARDFARGLVEDWALAATPSEFLEMFARWPVGPYDGACELVEAVHAVARVGCLSNTNAMHWEAALARWPLLLQGFDDLFLSFEIGLVKPDRALFDRVATQLATEPSRILFFDDNVINTDAARQAGYRAHRVAGPAEARSVLIDSGVLRASQEDPTSGDQL